MPKYSEGMLRIPKKKLVGNAEKVKYIKPDEVVFGNPMIKKGPNLASWLRPV